MERMLEGMVIFVAKIHNYILSLNDAYEKNFTDKQLHFLVIGILGMLILMVIYPLFKLLSENHISGDCIYLCIYSNRSYYFCY